MTDDETPDEVEVVAHACPECGKEFGSASGLGTHRALTHGVASPRRKDGDSSPARGSRRKAKAGGRQQRRAQQVRETLQELTAFSDELRGRGETNIPADLADVIKRDAAKIADSLAWVAERLSPVGFLIDKTMGHGGVITIARGFNGIILHGLRSWRGMLERRRQEQELEQAQLYDLPPEEVQVGEGQDGSTFGGP